MRIAIGSDHAGFELKSAIKAWLLEQGHEVVDLGTDSADRTDYPRYGAAVGLAVADGSVERGVAVCGSGQGICMAVNKVSGTRGAVVRDVQDAEMTRRHNDANVACFGERVTDTATALAALQVFLETPFDGGRHAARVVQLAEIDAARR